MIFVTATTGQGDPPSNMKVNSILMLIQLGSDMNVRAALVEDDITLITTACL